MAHTISPLKGYMPHHNDTEDIVHHPDHMPTPTKVKRTQRKMHADGKLSRHTLPKPPVGEPKHPHYVPRPAAIATALNDHHQRDFSTRAASAKQYEVDRENFVNKLETLKGAKYKSKKTIDDFDIYQTLGEGAFGRVVLAQDPEGDEDDYWAIKIQDKQELVDCEEVEHVNSEKNLLFSLNSRFVVAFHDYFHDAVNLMYVLEFVNGGEFMHYIREQEGGILQPDVCTFYMAELVLGLDYLHNLDIIYRDLKPENLLLTSTAHLKITDFGFAKRIPHDGYTYTFCGTPEYICPEIVKHTGYSIAADWWAFGVVVYECRAGVTPFSAASELQIFSKILGARYVFKDHFTTVEKLFIGGFLQADKTRRMGYMHGGSELIKQQPYFREIDWAALAEGKVAPPGTVQLEVDGPGDASNFADDPHDPFRDPLTFEGEPEEGDFDGAFDHF